VVDTDSPYLDVLRFLINAEWGVDFRAASTLDISRYRDTDENWPVEDGYGALIARAAAGVPVELNTPVERIVWSPAGVGVVTGKGTVEAAAAIVTASTDALAGDVIQFDPPLPPGKQEAFAAVPLGRANKVGLKLDERALADVEEQSITVQIGPGATIGLRLRPFGRNLVDVYLAGPTCAALEVEGEAAMIEAAAEALAAILGGQTRRRITGTIASNWTSEPYIRGAYAAARPGCADKRRDLGLPIEGRLFFAGEATSPEFFSTAHGAWATGVAAAEAVAAGLHSASNDISR
jgi:monoamine oxidase